MRNEQIEKIIKEAIDSSDKKCEEHSEAITRLSANQQYLKEDISEIKALNARVLVQVSDLKDAILIFKTQRNMVMGAICGLGTIIGLIFGFVIDYLSKKLGIG